MDAFSRTELLLGKPAMEKLKQSTVAVFGLGGVGGYVVEALARSGVGALVLVDHDTVSLTNINRQIFATHSTVGMDKAEVAKARVLDIHPEISVTAHKIFYGPDTASCFDFSKYDYVVDAIDTVAAKIDIIVRCKEAGTPVISSMGTGNKLDPTRFEIADIDKTSVCPLAKVIRKAMRDRGIKGVKVLYSKEEPVKTGSRTPGSISFVPSAAGLIIGGEVIKDLIGA